MITQAVPCRNVGGQALIGHLFPENAARQRQEDGGYQLPSGYVVGALAADLDLVRDAKTPDTFLVSPASWTTDNCLKYSEAEMLERANEAEAIAAQVGLCQLQA